MLNFNITNSHLVSNKMKIDLNMFRSLVLHRIGGHVDGTDIVTIDQRSMAKWSLEFTKKLTQPRNFCHSISNGVIFSFSTGAGDSVLSFGRPEVDFRVSEQPAQSASE